MVIGRHDHPVVERTTGNSLIQNLLECGIVRVCLNAVGVSLCVADPHTENLIRQLFICQ